jgi:hypothetical protein
MKSILKRTRWTPWRDPFTAWIIHVIKFPLKSKPVTNETPQKVSDWTFDMQRRNQPKTTIFFLFFSFLVGELQYIIVNLTKCEGSCPVPRNSEGAPSKMWLEVELDWYIVVYNGHSILFQDFAQHYYFPAYLGSCRTESLSASGLRNGI